MKWVLEEVSRARPDAREHTDVAIERSPRSARTLCRRPRRDTRAFTTRQRLANVPDRARPLRGQFWIHPTRRDRTVSTASTVLDGHGDLLREGELGEGERLEAELCASGPGACGRECVSFEMWVSSSRADDGAAG